MLATVGQANHPEVCRFALIYRWPLVIPYHVASDIAVIQAEPVIRELSGGAKTIQQLLAPQAQASSAQVASTEIRVAEWIFEMPGVKLGD